ncbi:RNA polymerase subunit sigma-24 [Antribacter sp. KLBMP9083]|uniref:RNA polymerase subunit sigma-24 n=1 Tax=Antribacter soli TaxID=2910976 RepID=A0AA41U8N4_9MICO|nr:RNA polymerase subunit sigma-24 [Antribacter soli]
MIGGGPPGTGPVETAFRDQWGRLLALLVARYQRLDLAEDGLADAFEAAARTWPDDGAPANPAAWLLTAARRRILDRLRAEAVAARKEPLIVVEESLRHQALDDLAFPPDDRPASGGAVHPGDPTGVGQLRDERLRLVLLCAHPALAPEAAAALSLRLVLGVPTVEIARLFLVPEATMAARLTRAKRRLAAVGAPFALPGPDRLGARIAVVASVAYLAFTAGYAPGTGDEVVRASLAEPAIRLAQVVRSLLPERPVLDALLALMLLQHARRLARVGVDGGLVLLPDQDRSRWRHDEIAEGLAVLKPLLERESELWPASAGRPVRESGSAGSAGSVVPDPAEARLAREYFLQALVAAEHAAAPTADATRWDRIASHYAALEELTGSPVVRLNRAVAVAEVDGPAAGLALLDGLDERLPRSHRLPAARAELLVRADRTQAALAEYDRALALCGNDRERAHLERRRAQVAATT